MRIWFLLFIITFFNPSSVLAKTTPLILLSIDGFGNNYLQKYQPKNLLTLAKEGVQADSLIPVFPSKTFPNHVSIITGLYPANHGIVHNRFYHPELEETYTLGAGKNNASWLQGTPLWTVAEQQQVKTAVYFWPESETVKADTLPRYYFRYNSKVPNHERIDQIIAWLNLPEKDKPQFITAYFSTVDTTGHEHGPNSPQLAKAVYEIDNEIGRLLDGIKELGTEVNIVIVSDHGMIELNPKNIEVESLFSISEPAIISNGQTQLYVYSEDTEYLNSKFKQLSNNKHSRFTPYLKSNYPVHWHLNGISPAIPDMILDAKQPYVFSSKSELNSVGFHGYDSLNNSDLNAIFIASGPSFKNNVKTSAFSNIHIYPMLLNVLGLKPTERIDGDLKKLAPILIK